MLFLFFHIPTPDPTPLGTGRVSRTGIRNENSLESVETTTTVLAPLALEGRAESMEVGVEEIDTETKTVESTELGHT